MNSKQKGKRGERQWRDELRANGYDARRGQQFAGSPDSPDVVCDALSWIHFEVKLVERLRVQDAMDQASRDAGTTKVPIVAHKRNFRLWLVTMEAETFFRLLRGDFPQQESTQSNKETATSPLILSPKGGEEEKAEIWAPTQQRPTDLVEPLRGNTSPQPSPQSGEGETISNDSASQCEPGIQKNENEQNKLQKELNETESK